MVQTGSYSCIHRFEVLFDRLMKGSDSVDRMVIHVWAQPPFLSLGIPGSNLRHCAFCAKAPGELLVLCHFFGGFLGAGVYIVAEVIPDLGLLRGVFQGFGRRSRIQKLETDILDNPSPANYEELGELYKDQGQYEKARDAFNRAITGRSDSIYTFYSRAQSSLGMNDLAAAIPDLERVVAGDRKFDYYRAAGLLANAYAQTGQLDRADQVFAEVTQISTTPETLYNYASFLKTANRRDESREWAQKLLAKKRTLPR